MSNTSEASNQRIEFRCAGGSGPKPFQDVSSTLISGATLLKTPGGVEDFVVWENKNKVIYRSQHNQLNAIALPSQRVTRLTTMGLPLSRIVDEDERFLLSASGNWVFDADYGPRWIQFGAGPRPIEHLFWNRGTLYSYDLELADSKMKELRIYRYRAGDADASPALLGTSEWQGSQACLRAPIPFHFPLRKQARGKRIFAGVPEGGCAYLRRGNLV